MTEKLLNLNPGKIFKIKLFDHVCDCPGKCVLNSLPLVSSKYSLQVPIIAF